MAAPTNLNRARKRKQREAKERASAEARAREGQSKAERAAHASAEAVEARRLAGLRLEPAGSSAEGHEIDPGGDELRENPGPERE